MPVISVRIPQMGEGLQEARLIDFLKRPGDSIRRDEPIYVMETDKAVTEVESPYEGTLVGWLVDPDTVLPIGAEIARMDVPEGVAEIPVHPTHRPIPERTGGTAAASHHTASTAGPPAVPIPPRTRKYLREKGLLEQAHLIPSAGHKLMPEDVDRYLAHAGAGRVPAPGGEFDERLLPQQQQTLNYRMQRGAQACIPAVIAMDVDWTALAAAREKARETSGETSFSMMLWCVVQALRRHPGFRSALSSDGKTLRTYHHVNLGVAVAIPGDLLRTAVVRSADTLDRKAFRESLGEQIERVRGGEDQVDETTTLTVSNIGSAGVCWGVPVVVTPAVGTLALGEVRPRACPGPDGVVFRKMATLTLAFDHRVNNGIGAANFLQEVRQLIESYVEGGCDERH